MLQKCTSKPLIVLAQKIALGAAGLASLSVVAVEPAHSQFGIDIAAILAGLKEVNSLDREALLGLMHTQREQFTSLIAAQE